MGTVRFILGRAATGKTRHVVDQISALCRADPLGPPVYWLVPKQATFQAERLLTVTLGGFARVRVVDFGKLGQAVLDDCGDVGVPEVTPAGRRMVIGQLLRKHRNRLAYYGTSALRSGLAAELDATFAEFERAKLDEPTLADLLDTLDPAADPANDALRQKLADVHLLLKAYAAHLGTERLDPQRRLALVLDRVAHCSALAGATLFVDDFYDFTAYERQLLAAVAAAVGRTEIAMMVDPDDPAVADAGVAPSDLSVFHRTARAYRSLRVALRDGGVAVEPTLAMRTVHRPPGLTAVERGLFARGTAPPAATIEFFDAPDAPAEVDAVARQIRAATAGGSVRFRDVAVLVRSLGDYQEIVDASFGEHGITYFADHRRPAGHHPLLQMVRACLLIARGNWPHEAVMSLAKSGLVGLSDDDADELENYVLQHRLKGRPAWEAAADWGFRASLTRPEDAPEVTPPDAAVNRHRRQLVAGLAPLLRVARGKPPLVKDVARAVFDTLAAFGVPATMARWIAEAERAHDIERRGEHEQVWAETVALFDQMVDVIGDEVITAGDFLDVLDGGLEAFDLAIAPATVDGVLLGQIDRTRTPAVRLTFVLGMAEGQFPRVQQERLVLSDAERRALRKRQIDLDEDTDRQLLDERFLAYVAVTRPAERLVVSRPTADANGKAANPSPFWHELRRLSPAAEVARVPAASAADPATIGTPRQLVDALMRWVVKPPTVPDDGTLPALYQWLARHAPDGSAVDTVRFRAWRALSYDNRAHLDGGRAAALFPAPLSATVRQLEDATACPFRHFARYGLLLAERESADVTHVDLDNAYHAVIENLTRELLDGGTDWTQLDAAASRELIRKHVAKVGHELRAEVMLSSARNVYLLGHIERTLTRAVASLAEVTRRGRYQPQVANLRYGGRAKVPPLSVTTPAGRTVHLRGRIDRVDVNDKGTAFTVADYRLAPASLPLDKVYYGLSMQLLAQLLVVRDNPGHVLAAGEGVAGKWVPAAALLSAVLRSPGLVKHPDDAMAADHADFHLRNKPRGLIEDRAADSLDGGGGGPGASNVVAVYRKLDGSLGNRNATDVATAAEFAGLLRRVERQLGSAADRVVDGDVSVRPYLLGRQSPCSRCAYRTVCRFEPGVNPYRVLVPLRREDVLARVVAADDDERPR